MKTVKDLLQDDTQDYPTKYQKDFYEHFINKNLRVKDIGNPDDLPTNKMSSNKSKSIYMVK